MKRYLILGKLFFLTSVIALSSEHVFLLHGLARSSSSMKSMESFLADHNYSISNLDYPSRHFTIPELAKQVRKQIIRISEGKRISKYHFVTHSMGGIILRQIQATTPLPYIGRVVMLGPPNQGSEIVDKMGNRKVFQLVNGPSSLQLSTNTESIPNRLGPVSFELGVIAGDRSINLILSTMIPGKDDGKVSVNRTRVEGMKDFSLVHSSHPFLMNHQPAQEQTLHFLKTGRFIKE